MKKLIVVVFAMILSTAVYAGTFSDLKSAVIDARESLLTLLKDPAKRGQDQQALVKNTANRVSELFSKTKAPAGKESIFEETKKTWEEFKKTRESELVPAILAGKQDEADKIAIGVQKERLKKVLKGLDSLE